MRRLLVRVDSRKCHDVKFDLYLSVPFVKEPIELHAGEHMPTIAQQPHYRVDSAVLADWLKQRAPSTWWTVDGDPVLTEAMNFPCPSDDLAEHLRMLKK